MFKLGLVPLLASAAIMVTGLVLIVPLAAEAHRSGCHRWHSCPSDSGSYVCGDTGYASGCGEYEVATPAPTPRIPVRKTKVISSVDPVMPPPAREDPITTEYTGYRHQSQAPMAGHVRRFVKINYVDGVEESRVADHDQVITQSLQEIVEIGTLAPPTASVTAIKKATKGKFNWFSKVTKYDLNGTTTEEGKLLLLDGSKVIGSTHAKSGKFLFRNIAVHEGSRITIQKQEGWLFGGSKEDVSEAATLLKGMKSLETTYSVLHKLKPLTLQSK